MIIIVGIDFALLLFFLNWIESASCASQAKEKEKEKQRTLVEDNLFLTWYDTIELKQ